MMEWILKIHSKPLESIQDHGKTVEGRVPDPEDDDKDYSLMSTDDYILFKLTGDGEDKLVDEKYPIKYVCHYDTIEEMLEEEGLNNVLPNTETIEDGVQRYHSFPGYKKRAQEHGVYAIGLGEPVSV